MAVQSWRRHQRVALRRRGLVYVGDEAGKFHAVNCRAASASELGTGDQIISSANAVDGAKLFGSRQPTVQFTRRRARRSGRLAERLCTAPAFGCIAW